MTGPLTEQARALADRIGALAAAVSELDRRTNRSEKITIGVILGLALDLVLSIAVALILTSQAATDESLQAAVDRETATRQDALCPLYSLFLGTYNPNSRAEGPDRDVYIANFGVLRQGYASLDCTGPIVPPRIDAPR